MFQTRVNNNLDKVISRKIEVFHFASGLIRLINVQHARKLLVHIALFAWKRRTAINLYTYLVKLLEQPSLAFQVVEQNISGESVISYKKETHHRSHTTLLNSPRASLRVRARQVSILSASSAGGSLGQRHTAICNTKIHDAAALFSPSKFNELKKDTNSTTR